MSGYEDIRGYIKPLFFHRYKSEHKIWQQLQYFGIKHYSLVVGEGQKKNKISKIIPEK